MKVPIGWIRDLVDIPDAAPAFADRLTHAGLKVDAVERWRGAREALVVVDLRACAPIPETDHLQRAVAFDGEAERVVVCGAPNAAAGLKAVLARPGAVMPGGFTVGKKKIRGIESFGFLVSEKEIGLSDDHGGIITLPADVPAGTLFADWCDRNSARFELDITANRGDALSVFGVARDAAAIYGNPVRPPFRVPAGTGADGFVKIRIDCPDLCRRYAGRVVRGVTVGESPDWLKARLVAMGARPINNVVDVTNYVLFLAGHPIHAFDLAKLSGPGIVVRRPKPGETIRTLDGQERTPPADACLICDAERPVAVGGVMGGADSQVTAATRDLLIEVACFDPTSVRKTSRALGLKSDSSYRFERGIDERDTLRVLETAAALMEEICGGRADSATVDVLAVPAPPTTVELSVVRMNRFIGATVEESRMIGILESLGFETTPTGAGLYEVAVPSWRHDVSLEVDLAEEILRIHGYNNLPSTQPAAARGVAVASEYGRLQQARDHASALGYRECCNYSFLSPEEIDRYDATGAERAVIINPLGRDFSTLRPTLLPSLVKTVLFNRAKGNKELRLFETGHTYRLVPAAGERAITTVRIDLPAGPRDVVERPTIAFAVSARREACALNNDGRPVDFFDLKGHLEALAGGLGGKLDVAPLDAAPAFLHPGIAGAILVNGVRAGLIGKIHPERARVDDLPDDLLLAEFDLSVLLAAPGISRIAPLSRFPAALFDLALLVDIDKPQAALAATIAAAAGDRLAGLALFDHYQGERVAAGKKSLAYTLTFQAPDRTLEDAEIKAAVDRVIVALERDHGAKLRVQ